MKVTVLFSSSLSSTGHDFRRCGDRGLARVMNQGNIWSIMSDDRYDYEGVKAYCCSSPNARFDSPYQGWSRYPDLGESKFHPPPQMYCQRLCWNHGAFYILHFMARSVSGRTYSRCLEKRRSNASDGKSSEKEMRWQWGIQLD